MSRPSRREAGSERMEICPGEAVERPYRFTAEDAHHAMTGE